MTGWAVLGWAGAAAHGGPLCDALLEDTPSVAAVRAALVGGDDPNTICVYYKEVPLSSTAGGIVAAVLLPVISWPIVFSETTTKKRKSLPLSLGVARRDEAVVTLLLDAGARPYDSAVQEAVDRDAWGIAGVLIDRGAASTLTALRKPLAGDVERLQRAVALGIRLDAVTSIADPGRLLTDPAVTVGFLDAGLRPEILLGHAAREGRPEVFDVVLSRSDPSSQAAFQALSDAACAGRWAVVDKLAAAGVPWERPGTDAVVVDLVGRGSAAGLARALAAGASAEGQRGDGLPAIVVAAERGRLDLVDLLLAHGASADAAGPNGGTALQVAARAGRLDLVRALLERGASPEVGRPSPLLAALFEGHTAVAAALVRAGATVDDADVAQLVSQDSAAGVRWVLQTEGRPDRLVDGQTLAALAVDRHADDVLAVLLTTPGVPLGEAAVLAAKRGDADGLVRLLDAGAELEPLRTFAWGRVDADVEQILVERVGVARGEWLVDAARAGEVERVQRLLAHGAPPSSALEDASQKVEPLLLAAGAVPSRLLVERLLARGNVDKLERLGVRGAILDSSWPTVDERQVRWMIDHGADPTLGLRRAVDRGWSRVVPDLLAAGADVRSGGWLRDAARLGPATVDALLAAGHPYDRVAVWHDVVRCNVERLGAAPWAEPVVWAEVRGAAREAGCRREVRALFRSR